jgi:hypothetical protein
MNIVFVHIQASGGLISGINREEVLGLIDLNFLLLKDSDFLGIRLSSTLVEFGDLELMTTRLNQFIDFLALQGIHLQFDFEQLNIAKSLFLLRRQVEVRW